MAWAVERTAALLCGLALCAACARGGEAAVRLATAHRADLLVKVLCDGNLAPPAGGELRASEGGPVAALLVREGARVRRGQPLLRLALPDLAARSRDARAELDRLEAERAAGTAELARAEDEAAYRRRLAESDRRLLAAAAISRAAADADDLAARDAAARARAARERLAGLTGAGPGLRLDLARADAAALAARLAAATLRAPADGVVYGLPRSAGEAIAAGQVAARVTDPDHPHVRFRIDQPDLSRVAVGQRLLVTYNGLPGRTWEGTVRAGAAGLREAGGAGGRQVGEGEGEIADPRRELPLDVAVDVQVVAGERHGVLTVPRAALHSEGDRHAVYVLAGGHARRREVGVGLIGLTEVEITQGLAAGDRVIVEAPVPLTEGLAAHGAAA